jgi:hypothetical protein
MPAAAPNLSIHRYSVKSKLGAYASVIQGV